MAKLCLNLIRILGQRDKTDKTNARNMSLIKKTRICWKIAKVLVNLNGMEGQQTDRVRRFPKLQMSDKNYFKSRSIYQFFFVSFYPHWSWRYLHLIRHDICQKFYTSGFWGQKFYTVKVRNTALFTHDLTAYMHWI